MCFMARYFKSKKKSFKRFAKLKFNGGVNKFEPRTNLFHVLCHKSQFNSDLKQMNADVKNWKKSSFEKVPCHWSTQKLNFTQKAEPTPETIISDQRVDKKPTLVEHLKSSRLLGNYTWFDHFKYSYMISSVGCIPGIVFFVMHAESCHYPNVAIALCSMALCAAASSAATFTFVFFMPAIMLVVGGIGIVVVGCQIARPPLGGPGT